jgi:hypothetical protein
VDYRRQIREHTPIYIDRATLGMVKSLKYLGMHITEDLKWFHTSARQRLCYLRRLKKFHMANKTSTDAPLRAFCWAALYSICTVQRTIGGMLPALQEVKKIIKDFSQPGHRLFTLLPSGRWYWCIRLGNSFYHQAIRMLNSQD